MSDKTDTPVPTATVEFKVQKETKNTIQWAAEDPTLGVPTVYVSKEKLAELGVTDTLVMTLSSPSA